MTITADFYAADAIDAQADLVAVAKAKAAKQGLDFDTIANVSFENVTCSRCCGSGRMPYSAYAGVCFKCSGSGITLTPAGKSARAKYMAFRTENFTQPVQAVRVGDSVLNSSGKWVRVHAVNMEGTGCASIVDGVRIPMVSWTSSSSQYHVAPTATVVIKPSVEALRANIVAVAHLKGATVKFA